MVLLGLQNIFEFYPRCSGYYPFSVSISNSVLTSQHGHLVKCHLL